VIRSPRHGDWEVGKTPFKEFIVRAALVNVREYDRLGTRRFNAYIWLAESAWIFRIGKSMIPYT